MWPRGGDVDRSQENSSKEEDGDTITESEAEQSYETRYMQFQITTLTKHGKAKSSFKVPGLFPQPTSRSGNLIMLAVPNLLVPPSVLHLSKAFCETYFLRFL